MIDGKPMELGDSSADLEKGLLVVMELSRTRVFISNEVGDGPNGASSEGFLFDLDRWDLPLICTPSSKFDIGIGWSRPRLFIPRRARDEGEPPADTGISTSRTSRNADESPGDSGDTTRMVLSWKPSRSIFPPLVAEFDPLLE